MLSWYSPQVIKIMLEENLFTLSAFDWLMIAYIALFSALLSRLTVLACGATWVTSFL